MKLSVIIVNYNVRSFLDQCLRSVSIALKNIRSEVIVVDNNSLDGSVSMVKEKFPDFKLIINKENKGFSKANNQGIKEAKGEFIAILNPDTLVEENTFNKCIRFMESNSDAGAMGVRLINGKGNYLPESKRSLPSPGVAFYKIFGLTRIFPGSKLFGKYNLGYLNPESQHKVDVLPGAFMFIRKKALEKTGLFDEEFFMYGEDIDLSYRLIKAGYSNYYYPGTTIVHYKGESTKKSSLNYVVLFYKAMLIFTKKHFSLSRNNIFLLLINLAIYFRAGLSVVKRAAYKMFLPVLDTIIIFSGFLVLTPFWGKLLFNNSDYYPDEFIKFIVPGYIIIWIITLYINNGYKKSSKPVNIISGTIFILIIYALLPAGLRFSRALIILGGIIALFLTLFYRFIANKMGISVFKLYPTIKNSLIISSYSEFQKLKKIIPEMAEERIITGFVNPGKASEEYNSLGPINQISEIIKINKVEEIIFSAKSISTEQIIQNMMKLDGHNIEFKIAQPDEASIIGSHSVDKKGEIFDIKFNDVNKKTNRIRKRILDLVISGFFVVTFPISAIMVKNKIGFLNNIFKVISGKRAWIGYDLEDNNLNSKHGLIKKGILTPASMHETKNKKEINRINLSFAKDYNYFNDLEIIIKKWNDLGDMIEK